VGARELAEERRPDLGLGEEERLEPELPQEPAHDARGIEGEEKRQVRLRKRAGEREPALGERRDHAETPRIALAERPEPPPPRLPGGRGPGEARGQPRPTRYGSHRRPVGRVHDALDHPAALTAAAAARVTRASAASTACRASSTESPTTTGSLATRTTRANGHGTTMRSQLPSRQAGRAA